MGRPPDPTRRTAPQGLGKDLFLEGMVAKGYKIFYELIIVIPINITAIAIIF